MLAKLLPVPFKFATADMKANARRIAAYVAMNFISSVDYYSGSSASVFIERQLESTQIVEAQASSLGGSIGSAWYEGVDIWAARTVRKPHEAHSGLMGSLLEITKAMEIALKTEDFAESHLDAMYAIGGSSAQLAYSVGDLLLTVTYAAADDDISASVKADLKNKEVAIQEDLSLIAFPVGLKGVRNPRGLEVCFLEGSEHRLGQVFGIGLRRRLRVQLRLRVKRRRL